jgi:hypothetical protein
VLAITDHTLPGEHSQDESFHTCLAEIDATAHAGTVTLSGGETAKALESRTFNMQVL